MGVRGTDFTVIHNFDSETEVYVYSGIVEIINNNESIVQLTKGYTAEIKYNINGIIIKSSNAKKKY